MKFSQKNITLVIIVYFLSSIRLFAADLDLHYKFAAVSKPESPLENTWGSYQTDLYSGSFSHSYPIKVPPGVNGMHPDLQLTYNSHSASGKAGWVGAGWDLSTPYIQRDINYTRKSTGDDSFDLILGGKHDLVYVSAEGRYHTAIDSFFKIKAFNSDDSPALGNKDPEYWIVHMKDGTEYRFGHDDDARKKVQTSDTSFTRYKWRWHLDKITDPNGNTIRYSYDESNSGNNVGAVYLRKIQYNNDQQREVEFIREANPYTYLTIVQGSEQRLTERLKQIDIKIEGNLVRRYSLSYQSNDLGTKPLLSSITEYGSDGISPFPATAFTYQSLTRGFNSGQAWSWSRNTPIRETSSGNDTRNDVLDVNGDGLPDRGYEDNGWKIRLNTGSGFSSSDNQWIWNIGRAFRDAKRPDDSGDSADTKGAPMDMNRDGYLDYVWADDVDPGETIQINFGNSSRFGGIVNWTPPTDNVYVREVRSVQRSEPNVKGQLMDINGDGYPDYVKMAGENGLHSWLGNGNGFGLYFFWSNPVPNTDGYLWDFDSSGAHETQIGFYDMNGDGLQDIVDARDNNWRIYLNTGSNFIYGGQWGAGEKYTHDTQAYDPDDPNKDDPDRAGDERHDLFDINGDGLPDKVLGQEANHFLIRFNTGRGFTSEQQWPAGRVMPDNLIRDIEDEGSEVTRDYIDLNGDGLVDMIFQTSQDWQVYTNRAQKTDLLTAIKTPYGGTISVAYTSSRTFQNTRLPFNYWLVSTVSTSNGMSGDHALASSSSYSYQGGLYDYPTREFRGFSKVTETKADGSYTSYWFDQGPGKKGKQTQAAEYAANGTVYTITNDSWSSSTNGGVYTTLLEKRDEHSRDGLSTARTRRTEYANYDTYGNPGLIRHKNDAALSSDNLFEHFEYGYNTTQWIVDKPSRRYFSSEEGGSKLRDTKYYYDGNGFGAAPTRGNLTKQILYIDTGDDAVSTYAYDAYGNRISVTDPEGRVSTVEYDTAYHTFPVISTNALGQSSHQIPDPTTGAPLSKTDPNGNTILFAYDVFHRLVKKALPYDSLALPTEHISYSIDGIAPEHVTITKRETSGVNSFLKSYQFVDGLASLLQKKSAAEDGAKQIAVNYFYDVLGRVIKQTNPQLVNSSPEYSAANITSTGLSYTYDTIGRPTRVTNGDGNYRSRVFSHWMVTELDENGHRKEYAFNAKQHPVTIVEHNGSESYTTKYQYSLFGNLTSITDHLGNQTEYTYDSLGRKTSAHDLNLGNWDYAYDSVGNLISQTDGNGKTTKAVYDALNRKTQDDYLTDSDISYSYDNPIIGTLSKVVDAAGEVSFEYDSRLRKTKESRTMNGLTWSTQWQYDALNRVVSEKRPNGETVAYLYNNLGALDQIQGIVTGLDYNPAGQLTNRIYANGLATAFTYHPQSQRLLGVQTTGLQHYQYQYDNVGNITTISNNIDSSAETFTYDHIDRLTKVVSPEYTINYTLDAIGNIRSVDQSGAVTNYYYGKKGKLPHAPTAVIRSAPVIEQFIINGNEGLTTQPKVTAHSSVNGVPTEYMISENASFTGASWSQYQESVDYQFAAPLFGKKILYLKVRNSRDESSVVHATIEYLEDSNNDSVPDALDTDRDSMTDAYELLHGLDPGDPGDAGRDDDGDGLTNQEEAAAGSDPNMTDTDGDGLDDGIEILYGTNPEKIDTDSDGINDQWDAYPSTPVQPGWSRNYSSAFHLAAGGDQRFSTKTMTDIVGNGLMSLYLDSDSDGAVEGVDNCPHIANDSQMDTDTDGLGDACDYDDDNDGVFDALDNCPHMRNASQADFDADGFGDACDQDDDNDGMPDDWEVNFGQNPKDAGDASGDPDQDGITNLEEFTNGTSPLQSNSFPWTMFLPALLGAHK